MFRLVLEPHDGKGLGADPEEKREPVSDIDIAVVDSLKALDPEWPIREADLSSRRLIRVRESHSQIQSSDHHHQQQQPVTLLIIEV